MFRAMEAGGLPDSVKTQSLHIQDFFWPVCGGFLLILQYFLPILLQFLDIPYSLDSSQGSHHNIMVEFFL